MIEPHPNPTVGHSGADSARTTAPSADILTRARERGAAKQLAYYGEVTPQEAWALASSGDAKIIDVRTEAEWQYVGHIPGSVLVQWRALGASAPNPSFLDELAEHASKDDALLLLCRSAQRSHAAGIAAAAAGYGRVMNILEGFEGPIDDQGHRGALGGWRKAGLPWIQT
jgi:rhodanese-related sulfurtransferase